MLKTLVISNNNLRNVTSMRQEVGDFLDLTRYSLLPSRADAGLTLQNAEQFRNSKT